MKLGAEIRSRRGERSLEAIAAETGLTYSTLSRVERGRASSMATARALAAWLGWTVGQVVDAAETPVAGGG
jgi:transcriptional regulator with XRE-family HTH domain